MQNESQQLIRLINTEILNDEDQRWLLNYLNRPDLSELKSITLREYTSDVSQTQNILDPDHSKNLLNEIHTSIATRRKKDLSKMWMKIAALLLVSFSFGLCFFYSGSESLNKVSQAEISDIKPDKNRAMLTLGDGTQIVLDNSNNKLLVDKGNITIDHGPDGQAVYNAGPAAGSHPNADIEYNVISTPRAGQYQVVLSDGTKVWLNSSSSIRFPTAFKGKARIVKISGEAYFEVAKNADMPFRVISAKQTVEVLGTHFNINAYSDERAVKTTLVEGSVKVVQGEKSVLLKPGQQAQTKTTIDIVESPDVKAEISWKSGAFYFKDAGIETVMRQVARWYDLEIKYEGAIPEKQFNGQIARNVTVSEFLEILKYSGINFKIDGRTVTIMP